MIHVAYELVSLRTQVSSCHGESKPTTLQLRLYFFRKMQAKTKCTKSALSGNRFLSTANYFYFFFRPQARKPEPAAIESHLCTVNKNWKSILLYAEVKRLKALLSATEAADDLPLLFLIDEIFRGTN